MFYKMKPIKTHWIAGNFFFIGLTAGWSFYPITYGKRQYVVELRFPTNIQRIVAIEETQYIIYKYSKNRLFAGHRGKRVFSDSFTSIQVSESKSIHPCYLSKDVLKIYLPQIMKIVFQQYEAAEQFREELKKKVAEAEKWDGVVRKEETIC